MSSKCHEATQSKSLMMAIIELLEEIYSVEVNNKSFLVKIPYYYASWSSRHGNKCHGKKLADVTGSFLLSPSQKAGKAGNGLFCDHGVWVAKGDEPINVILYCTSIMHYT